MRYASAHFIPPTFSILPFADPCIQFSTDIFNVFDDTAPPTLAELGDELDCYLQTPIEHAPDAIKWWVDRRAMYPKLSRMALDYLTIPGQYRAPSPRRPRPC